LASALVGIGEFWILDFGFWILRMRELFGFPDSGTHQAGFWIEILIFCTNEAFGYRRSMDSTSILKLVQDFKIAIARF
jgi:hypothetical protein